ncbi:hypothetical protein SDC9_46695 [bioreactor metagenome]|uniref:C_GCAxxG_C_C family protein n=1 Tax=bioreactor metagenome TaxID=1076179 RepID=A0A644WA60_9ZZZZ
MENIESVKKVAFDLARFYENNYGCCSQCVLAAIKNTVGSNISDDVFKSCTGLGAGLAGAGYACGALTGGIMALSCFVGRDIENFPDPDGIRFKTFKLARRLVERFEKEYGENGGDCSAIQTKLMGRSYDILNGERDEFISAGGHDDVCPVVCGKAAEWVVEMLNEEGLI